MHLQLVPVVLYEGRAQKLKVQLTQPFFFDVGFKRLPPVVAPLYHTLGRCDEQSNVIELLEFLSLHEEY